jgi:hypothetical protein
MSSGVTPLRSYDELRRDALTLTHTTENFGMTHQPAKQTFYTNAETFMQKVQAHQRIKKIANGGWCVKSAAFFNAG